MERFLFQVGQRFDLIDADIAMTSAIKFVVNLEQPLVHIQIVCYKSGKGSVELLLIIDVDRADGSGHISELENFLRS